MLDVERIRQFAQKATSAKDAVSMESPQRERGLWSFLTWSFFLSQLAVGNAFSGGAAQAAHGFDGNPAGDASNSATPDTSALGSPDFQSFGVEDQQSAISPGAAAQTPPDASVAGPESGGSERLDLTGEVNLAARSLETDGGGAPEDRSMQPDVPPPDGDPEIQPPPISELPPDVGVPPIVIEIFPPVLETLDDVVDNLGPILDDLLVPVVETVEDLAGVIGPVLDNALTPVEALVGGVVAGLGPVLDPLLAPVAGVAEGVGDLIEPVGAIAGPLMDLADPIVDAIDPILAPIINVVDAGQPILDPVLDAVAPALDLIGPVAAPVLDILPLEIGGGMQVVGSPGAIEFADDVDGPVHELFEDGFYTEFGLALHEAPLADDLGAGDLLGNLAVPIDALFGDDAVNVGHVAPVGALQHEAGLRGLADGLI